MKVIESCSEKPKTITISDMKPSDCFMWDKRVFIAISPINSYNAINLETGYMGCFNASHTLTPLPNAVIVRNHVS